MWGRGERDSAMSLCAVHTRPPKGEGSVGQRELEPLIHGKGLTVRWGPEEARDITTR
jgi:hypothetical protein